MTGTRPRTDTSGLDPRLGSHLRAYLGAWPPRRPVDIVEWPGRLEPAWDGASVPAVAVASPTGTLVSVPPGAARPAEALAEASDVGSFRRILAGAVHEPGRASPWVTLRWSTEPADLPDVGVWLDAADPSLPDWLHAFPGRVLAAFGDGDGDGRYLAGAGIKRHTEWGGEIAVGTAENARGRGLARRIVAQAARAILAEGAVPLYVHDPANAPSARVADAAGFPDLGWRLMVVWGATP
ncbi:MAG: GNAT family N-acetyltransferase [Acidimicrobiales bacterium]